MEKEDKFGIDPEQVKKDIETGEYYTKARGWYDELYHRPLSERAFFILVTFFSAITIYLSTQVYLSMYPLAPVVPYIIQSDNIVDEFPVIRPLRGEPGEDINISLARFLITDYVNVRENYVYDVTKLEWGFNRIRSTSASDAFNQYQRQVNPQNPASPYNKYGRDKRRDVYISDIQLNLEQIPNTAKVMFTSNLSDGKEVQSNQWMANITFDFPALTVNQETNRVMQKNPQTNNFEEIKTVEFKVINYAVQEQTIY